MCTEISDEHPEEINDLSYYLKKLKKYVNIASILFFLTDLNSPNQIINFSTIGDILDISSCRVITYFHSVRPQITNMKSPEHTRKMPTLPLPPVPEFTIQELTSPSDTISHLSQPSVVGTTNFSLPLKATDIGIPKSPVQRVVLPVNEEAYEEGYDSDCCHAPWEGSEEVNFEIRKAEEEPLPSGPTLGTPVPSEDNHDKKWYLLMM